MKRWRSTAVLPGLVKRLFPMFRLLFSEDGGTSATNAARSMIWAVASLELEGISGRCFDTRSKQQKLHPSARDVDVHARILRVIDGAGGAAR